ncbi:MAG: acetoacetate--CoA ligase, partial [Enterobacterales bacterium]|nr:acetoacetate--CoA ligase [Enterobacterales bacterium]
MNKLWTPSETRISQSEMTRFQASFAEHLGQPISDYGELHQASIDNSDAFWQHLVAFYDVIGDGDLSPVCTDYSFDSYAWFTNYRLNFAENLLAKGADDACALQTIHESGKHTYITYAELRQQVANLQAALRDYVQPGDV